MLHTVSACKQGNGLHQASHSHLFDEKGLARLFNLGKYEHNFQRYDQLQEDLMQSRFLSKWLAHTYFKSANNGMPWGIWKPEYMPVGVAKYT